MAKKNILILGAGFGGLRAAIQIAKRLKKLSLQNDYELIIADKYDFHTFTPLLYEIATTSKEIADYLKLKSLVTYPLFELLKNKNITILNDEVKRLDLKQKIAHLKNHKINFNYLILAIGVETNYFDIPGLKENSFGLKSFDEAICIRNAIYFEIENGKTDLRIAIGGGGSTGVELAGEIKEWVCRHEKEKEQTCNAQITIIEKNETILTGFDSKVIEKATRRLDSLGIKIVNGQAVSKVVEKTLVLENGRLIPFDILIWAGGVKTPSFINDLPVKKDTRGRIETNGDLKISDNVYAIGDLTCVYDAKTKKPLPGVARAAISEANVAAKNIINEIKNEQGLSKSYSPTSYKPKSYPYIIPIGGKFAIAKVGPFVISGFWAWILKGLVELNYLISIMPFWKAIKIWVKGLKIFIQNERLG